MEKKNQKSTQKGVIHQFGEDGNIKAYNIKPKNPLAPTRAPLAAPRVPKEPRTCVNGKYMGSKVGKKVGINTDKTRWRCKTCKFLNDEENEKCHMCRDEKHILQEESKQRIMYKGNIRNIHGSRSNPPIPRPQAPMIGAKRNIQKSQVSKPNPLKVEGTPLSGQFGAKVTTLRDIGPDYEGYKKPMQRKKLGDTEDEAYKVYIYIYIYIYRNYLKTRREHQGQ